MLAIDSNILADHCAAFITFDRKLVKTARVLGVTSVREP
jgi:hypothetical protein